MEDEKRLGSHLILLLVSKVYRAYIAQRRMDLFVVVPDVGVFDNVLFSFLPSLILAVLNQFLFEISKQTLGTVLKSKFWSMIFGSC